MKKVSKKKNVKYIYILIDRETEMANKDKKENIQIHL